MGYFWGILYGKYICDDEMLSFYMFEICRIYFGFFLFYRDMWNVLNNE